jgi:hypothetical protein
VVFTTKLYRENGLRRQIIRPEKKDVARVCIIDNSCSRITKNNALYLDFIWLTRKIDPSKSKQYGIRLPFPVLCSYLDSSCCQCQFKVGNTELCSSTTSKAKLTTCLCDLALHFKTDRTYCDSSAMFWIVDTLKHRVFEPIDTVSYD